MAINISPPKQEADQITARTMRHLSAMGYIEETGPDEYKPTNFSRSLAIPIIGDGYPCL